jgi:hypothetical protein
MPATDKAMTVTTAQTLQPWPVLEPVRKEEERESAATHAVDGVGTGVDLGGLAADGCKMVSEALTPSHITGGKDAVSGFVTGGGDGASNAFHTVADCLPATDVTAETGSMIADVLSLAGDAVSTVASTTADAAVSIVSGVFDGL